MAGKYPSHRYHPSLGFDAATGTAEFVVVKSEEEDGQLEAADELWRDTPYTEEEHDEWKADNPKVKKAKKQEGVKEVKISDVLGNENLLGPEAPKREDFPSKTKFDAAMKAFKKENG